MTEERRSSREGGTERRKESGDERRMKVKVKGQGRE